MAKPSNLSHVYLDMNSEFSHFPVGICQLCLMTSGFFWRCCLVVTGSFSELYLGHQGSSCVADMGERKQQEPENGRKRSRQS